MIAALQTLYDLPGVRLVMLTSPDGVPIVTPGGPEGASNAGLGSEEALAALTAAWLSDVSRHAGQISWNAPQRAVLRAARGTLVLQRTHNAVLLVLLARGTKPEDVRLAMDGTTARIDRSVRGMGRRSTPAPPANSSGLVAGSSEPLSPLPAQVSGPPGEGVQASKGRATEDPSGN